MTGELRAWAVAAVCAAGLAVSWCHDRGQSAERRAAMARADSLGQRSESLEAVHVADSTAAAARTQWFADSLATLDRALGTGKDQAHRLAAAIIRDTGSVPRAQVLEALNAKDVVIAQQEAKIQTLAADTVEWRARWLGAAREVSSWRQIALDAQQQLEAANKRSAPRWGCTGGLSGLTGGGITAAAGVKIGPTVALGLGVTCGLHL